MGKSPSSFPVRGVPGGWRDEWSAPDDAAIVRAQFASWAAANAARATQVSNDAAPPRWARPLLDDRASGTDRHILIGISQPTNDPSQHRAFALQARYDAAAGGWVARLGEQNRNDQIECWEPAACAPATPLVFPTAASCLGAAVTRLIELVDRDAVDPAASR